MKKLSDKIELSYVYKIVLLFLDLCSVVFASYIALYVRFSIDGNTIPEEYLNSVKEILIINVILSFIIFYIFHLYSSL